ncbi:MAG: hypothetical protein ACK55I_12290, partial [bacterium]
VAGGLDGLVVNAVRQRANDLVEDADAHRTRALEVLDHLHPVDQLVAARLQVLDLGDLAVELDDLRTQVLVALVLVVGLVADEHVHHHHDSETGRRSHTEDGEELLAQLFPA